MKKIIFWLLILTTLYFSARIMLVWEKPNSENTEKIRFEIKKGSPLKKIAENLKEKKLIRDELVFRIFVRWEKVSNKLQAGTYYIPQNLNFSELVEVLQNGKTPEMKVTIPEGSTIAQIDAILAKKSLIDPGEFIQCAASCDLGFQISNLEGYLFPSTYFVNPQNFEVKKFLERLYKNFNLRIDPYRADLKTSKRDFYDIIRVASMVEREAFGGNLEEKQKIADVIWKRLDKNMPLGIDATTRYELNRWNEPLYTEDFESDSGYNTRRKRGLPPTAISNFSTPTFEAALFPIKTPYYYYLHDCSSKIEFAKTLEGHNRNKYRVKIPGRDC